jgi:hypothetical protein
MSLNQLYHQISVFTCPKKFLRLGGIDIVVDAFATVKFSNIVFTSQALQYNTNLLFSRIMMPGGSTDVSASLFCASFVCHHRFLFRLNDKLKLS